MGSPTSIAFAMPPRQRFRRTRYLVVAAVALFIVTTFWDNISISSSPKIQHKSFKTRSPHLLTQTARRKAVEKEFLHAWYGYKDHAWMTDSLRSVSGVGKQQFCGWSATLVDTLDTLWIMGFKEEFNEAVEATLSIDFVGKAEGCSISLFETTIRYLGGMLAAYDLSGDKRLLPKMVELGDLLYGQFRTTTGMPCYICTPVKPNEPRPEPNLWMPLADVGSLYLEFARLSQVTGDPKYFDIVNFLTGVFEATQNSSTIPGLWPERLDGTSINGTSPKFASEAYGYSLGAYSDSAYEYLVKTHLLLGGITNRYANMWHKAAKPIIENILFRAYVPETVKKEVLFTGIATRYWDSERTMLQPRIEHLGCFAGGMFAMSARIFDIPSDLEIGKQLTEGCIWAYQTSPVGIMPETATLLDCSEEQGGQQCAWNQTVWDSLGSTHPEGIVWASDARYILRPEAIESVFILYRITGDERYRDVGWHMFQSIIKQTRTPFGHTSLHDVMNPLPQNVTVNGRTKLQTMAFQDDEMESFWLAETLKYFWLLFASPDNISLDEWVFNTEAHPLRLTPGIRGS